MPNRVAELDILRGVAIAIMIVVDAPPAEIYPLLKHAAWEGLTIADLAFPGFVFAMGISTAISVSRHTPSFEKIFKRSVILFLLGIFLNTLPYVFMLFLWQEFSAAEFFSRAVEHSRILGILQRLALTYLLAMLVIKFLQTDKKIFCAAIVILILSSAGFHVYAPENPFALENNISRTVDLIFPGANHLLTPNFDPEGLYGTFSSAAQMLLGFLAGKILLKNISVREKIYCVLVGAVILLALGIFWLNFDIIAKNIWTAPFTLITSALELFFLTAILKFRAKKIFQPLQAIGKSPIIFFLAPQFVLIFCLVLRIETISAWLWIYQHTVQGIGSTEFATTIFCLSWCVLWLFVAELVNRKNVVIKI